MKDNESGIKSIGLGNFLHPDTEGSYDIAENAKMLRPDDGEFVKWFGKKTAHNIRELFASIVGACVVDFKKSEFDPDNNLSEIKELIEKGENISMVINHPDKLATIGFGLMMQKFEGSDLVEKIAILARLSLFKISFYVRALCAANIIPVASPYVEKPVGTKVNGEVQTAHDENLAPVVFAEACTSRLIDQNGKSIFIPFYPMSVTSVAGKDGIVVPTMIDTGDVWRPDRSLPKMNPFKKKPIILKFAKPQKISEIVDKDNDKAFELYKKFMMHYIIMQVNANLEEKREKLFEDEEEGKTFLEDIKLSLTNPLFHDDLVEYVKEVIEKLEEKDEDNEFFALAKMHYKSHLRIMKMFRRIKDKIRRSFEVWLQVAQMMPEDIRGPLASECLKISQKSKKESLDLTNIQD